MAAEMNRHLEMISSTDVDVMLLKQKNEDFYKTLNRIESKLDQLEKKIDEGFIRIENKIDSNFKILDSKIDSNFKWTIKSTYGLYVIAISAAIGIIIKLVWG